MSKSLTQTLNVIIVWKLKVLFLLSSFLTFIGSFAQKTSLKKSVHWSESRLRSCDRSEWMQIPVSSLMAADFYLSPHSPFFLFLPRKYLSSFLKHTSLMAKDIWSSICCCWNTSRPLTSEWTNITLELLPSTLSELQECGRSETLSSHWPKKLWLLHILFITSFMLLQFFFSVKKSNTALCVRFRVQRLIFNLQNVNKKKTL